jgi:hypothetical protein
MSGWVDVDGRMGAVMCFRPGFVVIFENPLYGMTDRGVVLLIVLLTFSSKTSCTFVRFYYQLKEMMNGLTDSVTQVEVT